MAGEFIGGITVKAGDGGTPESFDTIENLDNIPGFGVNYTTVDVTSYADSIRRFISGLGEASEFTTEHKRTFAASNIQDTVKGYKGTSGNFQIDYTDGTNTKTLDFEVIYMGYQETPSMDDSAKISFTYKISGDLTES